MGRRDRDDLGEPIMAQLTVEQRLTSLEEKIAQLSAAIHLPLKPGKYDWLKTVGMFGNDEVMKEIDALALKYREDDRRKARKRRASRQGKR